jgi:hypothetical protein
MKFLADCLAVWSEWRFARQAARKALDCRRLLQDAHPNLRGRDFYEAFVCAYAGVGSAAALTILRRAEASFASWPNERELEFRDLVQYLAVSDFLRSHPKRSGTIANMVRVISNIVPTGL